MTITITPETNLQEFIEKVVSDIKKRNLDISEKGLAPWSPSKIKTLANCPLQFLLKNILYIRYEIPVDPTLEQNADMFLSGIGTSAHYILEEMLAGRGFEQALALAEEKYKKEVTEHHWHRVERLAENLKHFMFRLERFSVDHPIERVLTEQKYAVDIDWNPVEMTSKEAFFRGVVDLPVILKNWDSLLIDHKHGGTAKYGVKNYGLQLRSYSILMVANHKEIAGVTPMIHFMEEGDVAKGEYASRDKILNEYTNSLVSTIDGAIENVKSKGAFCHSTGNYCNYCEFKPLCRGGKRGTANHLQPIVEASKIFFKE